MVSEDITDNEKGFGYEIFIAAVSVLSIFNLLVIFIPGVNPEAVQVINIINLFLTLIFILDFVYRITTTKSRSYYLVHDFGWADFLACSPNLRFLRLFRIFKAYRLFKKHDSREIIDYLSYNRAESALYILVFSVIVILEVGSFLVLTAEKMSPDANITTAGDALWWAYVTITTVGYGDKYPVTGAGRLVGILVMTTGVGIFATFAGYIANKLLTPHKKEEEKLEEELSEFERQIIARMDELQSSVSKQERKGNEIAVKLERLERLLAERKPVPPADEQKMAEAPGEGPEPDDHKEKTGKSNASYKSVFWKKYSR